MRSSAASDVYKRQLFYVDEGATDDRFAAARQSNLEAWSVVFNEDVGPCERMQLGRQSPGYQGGGFSPVLDICSHHFHQWVARNYLDNSTAT